MARRQYLISYDISDDKRRNRVFDTLKDYGEHVQFSVFFAQLSSMELVQLRARLAEAIHNEDDQVIILDLGDAASPLDGILDCLGKRYNPRARVQVV
jgi:CRISPR-associated protein Cas2